MFKRDLEIPRSEDIFDHFSEGVKVTRILGEERQTVELAEAVNRGWVKPRGQDNYQEIGIEVNREEGRKGCDFSGRGKAGCPQFVATGESQLDDVKKLIEEGGTLVRKADQIVENFISNQMPQ